MEYFRSGSKSPAIQVGTRPHIGKNGGSQESSLYLNFSSGRGGKGRFITKAERQGQRPDWWRWSDAVARRALSRAMGLIRKPAVGVPVCCEQKVHHPTLPPYSGAPWHRGGGEAVSWNSLTG